MCSQPAHPKFKLRQERPILEMPPLTGLNDFMICLLQRCRTYGAAQPNAASAEVPSHKTMTRIRRITPMLPGAEVLENIKALL